MFAIFKRELRSFYTTPIGFVFSGIVILLMNVGFYVMNVSVNESDVKPLFNLLLIGLAFIVPILTMRLLSEDKKLKTDQLLLTAPITVTDVVMGKFLAALAVFVISLVGTFLIPLVLAIYSVSEPWAIVGNYFAIISAASCFIAIGLFISSLTESQLVASILSWAVLIGMLFIDMVVATSEILIFKVIIGWVSVFSRFSNFTYGLFDLSSIVYYLSVTLIFIFLTVRMVDKRRYA
ncbi:MAG: ABC transporter permease subunit [Clostridia bacterium]|nr:ABC transporter permease subunit [Clostridia bacterium]